MNHAHAGWRDAILLVALIPLLYYAMASFVAWRFFRKIRACKLPEFTPPVSILKPLHGIDFASYENYVSFCRQDYPDYEILFAVNEDTDPAVPLLRRLLAEFPARRIRVLVGAEQLGANRKVNSLISLVREAQHEIVVLSDGDVRVGPQYLRQVVAPFTSKKTGAVTCFYRAIAERNLGAEIEAVGASSDFFAGVLMAQWTEGISFGLGASIATTKRWLAKIGGLEAIADVLADDYELGNRIVKAGGEVVLSAESVWTMYPAQTARSFWQHQLRWARTVRACRPLAYAALILTQGLPWVVLAALVAPTKWIALLFVLCYVILRSALAWIVGIWGIQDEVLRRRLWLVPLRDAVRFIIWLASFTSNRVTWGGREYIVDRGKMVPVVSENETTAGKATIRAPR